MKHSFSTRPQAAGLVLGLATAMLAGCAGSGTPAPESAAVATKTGGKADAKTEGQKKDTPKKKDEPKVDWLVDEEGRQYQLDKLPKKGVKHTKIEGNKVRTVWGIVVDLAKEDDDYFYVKLYKVEDVPPPPPSGPTPEQKAAIEKSYEVSIKTSDTLRLVPFETGLPTTGQWRHGFRLADINEDGHLDVIHGPERKRPGHPMIFLGDGKGTWRRWTEATFPPFQFDYGDAVAADFDGDGHLDLALGMHLKGVVALRNDGKGHFELWSDGIPANGITVEDKSAFSSRAIAAVDWNRDGKVDLLAFGEGPRPMLSPLGPNERSSSRGVMLFLNEGKGRWTRRADGTQSGNLPFGDGMVVADIDGDGRPDFLTATSAAGLADILCTANESDLWICNPIEGTRPFSYIRGVAVADFDRDGRADIALGYQSFEGEEWRSGIDVFLQKKHLVFERMTLWSEKSREGVWALGTGDLNGDKAPDLVATTGDARVMVFLGNGKGGFMRETHQPNPPISACRGSHIEIADLDGDGRDDIVASFAGEPEGGKGPYGPAAGGCPGDGSIRAWRSVKK